MADAKVRAVITAEDRATQTIQGVGGAVEKMGDRMTKALKKATIVGVTAFTGALAAASKMAFEQVRSVENATFALRAYEKDTKKVNKVLAELVAFARSDMGVLFQRDELFKAASNLRGFGVASDEVVDKVKLLSRGVALGMTNFDELSQIIGRVVQRGRIDADVFDMLAQRGIILSSSFRGAAVSSEKLFKELERVLPAELLEGRANTIDGAFIRLKSAFRDIGATILGVDKETSRFIEGGLGDRFIKAIRKFRDALASPRLKQTVQDVVDTLLLLFTGDFKGKMFGGRFEEDDPVIDVILTIRENIGQLIKTATHLATVFRDFVARAVDALDESFFALVATVRDQLWPTIQRLWKEVLEPLAPVLGVVIVAALFVLINTLRILITVFTTLQNWTVTVITALVSGFNNARNSLVSAFEFIVERLVWLKDNFWQTVGFIVGFFATLPFKLPFFAAAAIAKVVKIILGVNWGNVFISLFNAWKNGWVLMFRIAENVFLKVKNLEWGKIMLGIGKSLANAIIGLIEGAIRGALAGVPGVGKKFANISLPRFAKGVTNFGGGLAVVGEQGPEVVSLPRGSSVTPNGALGNVTINIQAGAFMGSRLEARKFAEMVVNDIKDIAGSRNMSVQQMLGA